MTCPGRNGSWVVEPEIEIRSYEFKFKVLVPHCSLTLPVEPHLHANSVILVIRMMRCWAFSSSGIGERALSVPAATALSLLKSCNVELSTETYFLADFSWDWGKSVSCQDIWEGKKKKKTPCTSLMSSSVPACLIWYLERLSLTLHCFMGWLLTSDSNIISPSNHSLP